MSNVTEGEIGFQCHGRLWREAAGRFGNEVVGESVFKVEAGPLGLRLDTSGHLLWQCAKCASATNGGNPAVRALYARRLAKGDSPQVAWGYCMTKLLHQVFGVWTTNKPFDPNHEPRKTEPRETEAASHKADGQPIDQEVIAAPAPLEPVIVTLGEPVVVTPVASEPNDSQVIAAPAPLEPVDATATESLTTTTSATATSSSRRPIDYAALRERIPLLKVLEQLSRVPIQGEQHRGPCPLHEPTATSGRHFSANLKHQVFRCFHPNCQAQGNVLEIGRAHV